MHESKISSLFCLNPRYSTTRLVTQDRPITKTASDAKFKDMLLFSFNPQRGKEGGLRTKGYFKQKLSDKQLITVITAVFNGGDQLESTILSVINQSYNNVEYIIVDGGSTDGTLDIIRKYEHAIDYWVSGPDCGIYDAWNKGVTVSLGDWIGFLGAGDTYLPTGIETYSLLMSKSSEIEYLSSKVNLVSDGKVVRTIGSAWSWDTFKKFMNCAHVGSLHARSLFYRSGLYSTQFKIVGDYELLLRSRSCLKTAYIDKVTATMQVGGVSDSKCMVLWETARAKIETGNRSRVIAYCEMFFAFIKWKIRKKLWY